MFAHSEFEREVRSLQRAITNDPSFGERRTNQWKVRKRPELIAKLIRRHLGDDLQEIEPIVKLMSDAIGPCDQRDFLSHGEWWSFNTRKLTIAVRSGTQWNDGQPEHLEYTAQKIKALAEEFERLETELFKLRRRIEARWRAPTRVMNPTIPQSVVDLALEEDAAKNRSEYLAEFRQDLESFIAREQVELCVDRGVLERPPAAGIKYQCFTDPSGGAGDAMTAAVGHLQGAIVIVDALREVRPSARGTFDPDAAAAEFVQLFRRYGINRTNGDRYAAEWSARSFEKKGIAYKHCETPRSGLYLNLLPHLNSKTIRLLDHPRSINQICSLERSIRRGAADAIDHPRGQHDDLSNAIAGLAHVLSNARRDTYPAHMASWSDPFAGFRRMREQEAAAAEAAANCGSWTHPITGAAIAGSTPCLVDFAALECERTKNLVPGVTRRIGTSTRVW
jgi:hypothetical protein